jgi:CDP-glucose 4,6-dehydratase
MTADKTGFWFGKNVFITGINGFIGGNLARALLDNGAHVFGLVRNAARDTLLYYEKLDRRITLIEGEITDRDLLTRIVSEEQINAVFHLAAQVEVGVGLANPFLTFETNTRGTWCLMEAIRACPQSIAAVVVASTDKAYGAYPAERMPYKEDYPLLPRYPYDVSKACADMIARSYATEIYQLPVVVTRFCNIFGPGQLNFSALIPDAVRACLGYGKFVPRGSGQQIRDFIFVGDVVDLYLRIGERLARDAAVLRGRVYNAGTNQPRAVRDVLAAVYRLTQREREFAAVLEMMKGRETVGEIECQYMDYELVNRDFGWSPAHSFDAGVALTIEWFKGYLAHRYDA